MERHVQGYQQNFKESFINLQSNCTYSKGSIIKPALSIGFHLKMNFTSLKPRPNHISSFDFQSFSRKFTCSLAVS